MTVKDLYERLNLAFPPSLSLDCDRDGLMVCPDPGRRVRRVLVTLDVTPAAADAAIQAGADLILSHHPLLFHPLATLSYEDPGARTALKLAVAGISVACFHTRADAAHDGVSDLLAAALGLSNVETLGEERLLRVGTVRHPMSGEALARHVKEALGVPAVTLADAGQPVRWVAVSGGEGKDLIDLARANGADAYVSGRFGYHVMQDAAAAGLTLVEAGHYYTEVGILDRMKQLVLEATDAEVIVRAEPPIRVLS